MDRRIVTEKHLERVPAFQQVNPHAILRLETPLGRLEHALARRPVAREAHRGRGARALDGEPDVDAPLQLVHLTVDPRDLVPEVDVVAQQLARLLVGPQGVQRRRDDGRGHLLVVEDGDGAGGDDGGEDG